MADFPPPAPPIIAAGAPMFQSPPPRGTVGVGGLASPRDPVKISLPIVPPKMGGFTSDGYGGQIPWTGGKPNHAWTGLAEPSEIRSIMQVRPLDPKNGTSKAKDLREGLVNKHDPTKETLDDFCQRFLTRARYHGQDTITYVPLGDNDMQSILSNPHRISVDDLVSASKCRYDLYDSFDKVNDLTLKYCLYDSMIPSVSAVLLKKDPNDSLLFLEAFANLRQRYDPVSLSKYVELKSKLKALVPSQFPQQNIVLMIESVRDIYVQINQGGQMEGHLLKDILDNFLTADWDLKDKIPMLSRLDLLETTLLKTGHEMDRRFQQKTLEEAGCGLDDILALVEDRYHKAIGSSRFAPARNAIDSKAVPKSFGMNNVTMTKAQFNVLIQRMGGSTGQQSVKSRTKVTNKSSQQHGKCGNNNKKQNKFSIFAPPPKAGEPTVKTIGDKTKWWCPKCIRWTLSHGQPNAPEGIGHTGGRNEGKTTETVNLAAVDFSLWHVGFGGSFPFLSCLTAVLPMIFGVAMVSLGMLIGVCNTSVNPGCVKFQTHMSHLSPRVPDLRKTKLISCFKIVFPSLLSFWLGCLLPTPGLWWNIVYNFLYHYHWHTYAPLLWIILFGATLWVSYHPTAIRIGRSERRWIKKNARKWYKRRSSNCRQAFVRNCGRVWKNKYPQRLRSEGVYHSRSDLVPPYRQCTMPPLRENQRWKRNKSGYSNQQKSDTSMKQLFERCVYPSLHSCPKSGKATVNSVQEVSVLPTWMNAQQELAVSKVFQAFVSTSTPSATIASTLQDVFKFRNAMPKGDVFRVIWDSGASITVSPNLDDFVGPLESVGLKTKLQGLAKGLWVKGKGHVAWSFHDSNGMLRTIKVAAFHVPSCPVRLLSTTGLLQTYKDEMIHADAHRMMLSGVEGDPLRSSITALIDPRDNLPATTGYNYNSTQEPLKALNTTISVVSKENLNLSTPQKELLRWHFRLGHLSFRRIQALLRSGLLAHTGAQRSLHTAAAKLTSPPKCAACQFGKQCQRSTRATVSKPVSDRKDVLRTDIIFPGQKVAVDHFVCSTKGRLPTSKGKTSEDLMYCGGCMFVDLATSYVYVKFQCKLNTHETAEAKDEFEFQCRDHGVIVQQYHSDNGSAFTSKEYSDKLLKFEQISTFAGVGAHHHNAVAERAIRTIMTISRTMMLHSAIHWPEMADATLWPLAVNHAIFLYNHVPNEFTGISPHDLFTKTKWQTRHMHDIHVWGSPVYVLDKTISDGKKIPRWSPRSIRCINMGFSARHALSAPLVLNPDTGYITPQFHVVFDDWFNTVTTNADDLPDFNSPEWAQMFGNSVLQYPLDWNSTNEKVDDNEVANDNILASAFDRQSRVVAAMDRPIDDYRTTVPTMTATPLPTNSNPTSTLLSTKSDPTSPFTTLTQSDPTSPLQLTMNTKSDSTSPQPPLYSPTPPHSTIAIADATNVSSKTHTVPSTTNTTMPDSPVRGSEDKVDDIRRSNRTSKPPERYGEWQYYTPTATAFKASTDSDTLSYEEAMKSVERDEFVKAALSEIRALELNDTWEEVPISSAGTRVLPGTWVFRRKRTPDGVVYRYRSRYCVRGDLQIVDEETFAPVVAFSTVRLFLVLTLSLGWVSTTMDWSNAFAQAPLKTPIWIQVPRGFQSEGVHTCLKLKKSLYGTKIAPRAWYQHLLAALLALGFTQSQFDPCLMFKTGFLLILYVDDACVSAPKKENLESFVCDLRKSGFNLKMEDCLSEFLGIKYEKITKPKLESNKTHSNGLISADGSVGYNLTQCGLIKKLLSATGMEECRPLYTPAIPQALGSDPDGEPMQETWNYRSVAGMLLYLSGNTRPDIATAVSQICRFTHGPKQSHAKAVKHLMRYLKGTADKGTIIYPTGQLNLDNYSDADFSGLYGSEAESSPNSARSRIGFIIFLGDVPLIWKSQLCSEITTSTLHSEYIALSTSLRIQLVLKWMLQELSNGLDLSTETTSTIVCRAFEDNQGALLLANSNRLSARTRHYNVKWHWFWEIKDKEGLNVEGCGTSLMRADPMTKNLVREPLERLRKLNQGW